MAKWGYASAKGACARVKAVAKINKQAFAAQVHCPAPAAMVEAVSKCQM